MIRSRFKRARASWLRAALPEPYQLQHRREGDAEATAGALPYPHAFRCSGCEEEGRCHVCGVEYGRVRCTNHRCVACHALLCLHVDHPGRCAPTLVELKPVCPRCENNSGYYRTLGRDNDEIVNNCERCNPDQSSSSSGGGTIS
jgi:hypothetical protein